MEARNGREDPAVENVPGGGRISVFIPPDRDGEHPSGVKDLFRDVKRETADGLAPSQGFPAGRRARGVL
jgi:hypothetical protein